MEAQSHGSKAQRAMIAGPPKAEPPKAELRDAGVTAARYGVANRIEESHFAKEVVARDGIV